MMGPNAPLPGAANAHKLAGAAGDTFWSEFWAVHEQLIDFAAIAAAHEDFFKSSGAAAAGGTMPGPAAAAAAAKAGSRQPVVVAAEEQEEEGASVEIIMPMGMQPGRQPAGGAATTKAAPAAAPLAAQPGRALLMAAKQPGALPPPQAQDGSKQQPASDGATPDWQLSVYWPEVGFAEFQPVTGAAAAGRTTPREGQSFWPPASLGDGTASSGVDAAGAKLQAGSKRGSSASGTRLPTPRQGMSYGQQLKQAAAAGWQAWCRRAPGQSQSSRNLSELVPHTMPIAALNTVSSNRELCSPAGGDE